jgi:hypothetical protein
VKELSELEESFNEFQQSSEELEGEMEKELEMKDKKLEEVQSQYRRMKTDYDDYVVSKIGYFCWRTRYYSLLICLKKFRIKRERIMMNLERVFHLFR